MIPPLMAESEEDLKSLLMKVKVESEKVGLKLNIQETKIMASSSITSWQTHGENGNSERLYFSWAPKSLQVVDCSHEMQRHLLLERKAMTSIDRILISKDITFLTKFHLVKAVVFSSSHVCMWELDYKQSWALKNWYFWIVVLRKTLENPLDCKEVTPVKMSLMKKSTNNAGEGAEKREPSYIVGRNVNWCSHYGEQHVCLLSHSVMSNSLGPHGP